jgi:hypothetical protein
MPGIDPMLQKFLKKDVLVDFVSNHIYVWVFSKTAKCSKFFAIVN